MKALLPLLCFAVALTVQVPGIAQESGPATPAAADASVTAAFKDEAPPPGPSESALPAAALDAEEDLELDLGPVSAVARRMLDRVRDSVVQIRGFYGTNRSEAFHGSAFAVAPGGTLLTNYHVVSRAALFPRDYRLEYYTDDGRVGTVRILAIDVAHDLALIRADTLNPRPLQLRTVIPAKGDRAYAVGYPLNLGLVITEGIGNGRIDNEFSPKLHYAGPMNPGMSGGPALDSSGRVFGINVSISTRGQLVSFLIPAEFVAPLLEKARTPLAPGNTRIEVARQLWSHQSAVLAALPGTFPTQTSAGYALPAELAPFVDCTATLGVPPSRSVRLQSVTCRANVALSVEAGLLTGDFQFSHKVVVASGLDPLRFAEQLHRVAELAKPTAGSAQHVNPYACKSGAVNLNRFKSAVTLCARSYRMYEGLYDVTMVVVSLNQPQQGFVSTVTLRGVDYGAALDFSGRFLRAMRWTR
ncbi:MAG: serine protease [Gammaproteobacteria bacterium]